MGFSVSVAGDIDSNSHMVKMIVNTVYYQNLLENINEIEEDPIEEEDSFLEHSRNEMSDEDF